ncbi:Superoxide dismutase [Flavobacterium sp. 9AF]|uniref:superoxide dismutase family protein n=1 Tax=Flavobacterium sp. 9AF TaxID=2653142 RepID=UPI0012F020F4|nr:superoxide dismutase family protein [Flavobacterium sp. 9AF]VXC33723.1 Superoxide dismutase [Flavobacterium sp. 9AF]
MKIYLSIGLLCLAMVSCKKTVTVEENNTDIVTDIVTDTVTKSTTATAIIAAKSNSAVSGTVTFTENKGRVSMEAKITGLTPGIHAIHIHENGDCSAADASTAGGHWNPSHAAHGAWEHKSFHLGDIGNLEADENGIATLSKETDLWCIGCDDENKNIVGKSIVVHQNADDLKSQPSGAAGDRVGCGEIVKE